MSALPMHLNPGDNPREFRYGIHSWGDDTYAVVVRNRAGRIHTVVDNFEYKKEAEREVRAWTKDADAEYGVKENPLREDKLGPVGIALSAAAGLTAATGFYLLTRPAALVPVATPPAGAKTLSPVPLPLPTVPLIRGRHYYVAVSVNGLVHALASVASVIAYAQNKGLSNVQAYLSSSNLPSWWPPVTSGNIFCEGDWGQASQQANLPSQVVAAWILGPEIA